ncbi:MAG: hypothetical protein RL722_396 [Pseudomonadota bacterium]|jgi:hypothetical protein
MSPSVLPASSTDLQAVAGLAEEGPPEVGLARPAFVHRGGWQHLLPDLRGRRVICLSDDRSAVASLVRAGACVQWWPVDEAAAATPSADPGVPPFEATQAHLPPAADGAPEGQVDVLAVLALAPDPATVRAPDWEARLKVRMAEALARLASTAWLCWVGARAHAPPHLPADQGWTPLATRPLLTHGRHLLEVIAPAGYRSTRNRELHRERIKEWVYGPILARWTAPARLCTAQRGAAGPVVLSQALTAIARHLGSPCEPTILQQQLLAGGKTILTLALPGRAPVVAVLVGDALSKGRRRAEVGILGRLASLDGPLTRLLPHVLGELEVAGQLCLLLNCLPGVTLDRAVAALPAVTEACVDFLINLQAARSPELAALPPTDPAPLVYQWLGSAVARNPQLAPLIAALEPSITALAPTQPLSPVWMHGDFKIENVLYDLKSRHLTGVIDWEHARCPGLPLVDLYYLLTYNRQMAGQGFGEAADALLDPQRRSADEARLIQRYCSSSGITPALLPLLDTAFVLHHLGVRIHGFENSRSVPPTQALLQRLAVRLAAAVAALPARSGLSGAGAMPAPSVDGQARTAGSWHVPV